jgi:hypothetical protein
MTLASVAPQQLALGGPDSPITLTGTGFLPSDVVLWNGTKLATALVNATTLTATVPASLLTNPSDGFISVSDPACPGANLCSLSVDGPVVQVGTSTRGVVGGNVADAAWDATHAELLLLSFDNSIVEARTPSNTLVAATQGDSSTERRQLAVSDQDQFVYVSRGFDSTPATALKLALPGLTNGVTLSGFTGSDQILSLAPAPGAPSTVALLNGALAVVDGATARSRTASSAGMFTIAWGVDASTIYGLAPATPGIVRFDVDENGITGKTTQGSAQFSFGDILHYDRTSRRLYGDSGWNYDEQGADPRPFSISGPGRNSCVAVMDADLGKAFFGCLDQDIGYTVQSFDLATQQFIGHIVLHPASGFNAPMRVFRFGADGLGVVANAALYTYQGPFVH